MKSQFGHLILIVLYLCWVVWLFFIVEPIPEPKQEITVKELFNALPPETQDEVKFAYAYLLWVKGENTDNAEDVALSILSSSESPIRQK
jgi:hypothetical protein